MALDVAGSRAPSVLARYVALTYLNRTSRGRPIRRLPRRAMGSRALSAAAWDVDIIVPVYNDFEGINGVLRVLRREAPQFNSIVLVHDCSTDPRVAPLLRAFCNEVQNAVLLENERNLGFLRTCNRGFAASQHDVVILNSDVGLPRGALGRLVETLQVNKDIATVTPFSSNAYGAGFPDLNYENRRPFGATTAQVDAAFQAIGPFEPVDIPRGVGFCMAIARRVIDCIGAFDPEFGAGYGEEADFCLRARQSGFRNVLAPNTYVYHKAGQSFGASSQRRAREGLVRLLLRHPNYPELVRGYLEANEARAICFAAMAALLARYAGNCQKVGSPSEALIPEVLRRSFTVPMARLGLANEVYWFPFANSRIAAEALQLFELKG